MSNPSIYRAKRIDINQYVYGYYLTCPLTVENFGNGFIKSPSMEKIHCIASIDGVLYQIDFKTLEEKTEVKDCYRKDIYEGDRVLVKGEHVSFERTAIVVWDTEDLTFALWFSLNGPLGDRSNMPFLHALSKYTGENSKYLQLI